MDKMVLLDRLDQQDSPVLLVREDLKDFLEKGALQV
jgi:hypothetical protein